MIASGASPHFIQLHIYYHQHSSAKASEALSGDRTDILLLQAYFAISREMVRVGLWPNQLYRVIAFTAPTHLKAIESNKGSCLYCSITPLKCQRKQN